MKHCTHNYNYKDIVNYAWNLLFDDGRDDIGDDEEVPQDVELFNRDGSTRKRKREDYSRGPKRQTSRDYWADILYSDILILLILELETVGSLERNLEYLTLCF